MAIMDKVAIMAKYGHLAILAMAIAEFLNVIVSTLCDGAEFLWLCAKFWDLYVQAGKFMILFIF